MEKNTTQLSTPDSIAMILKQFFELPKWTFQKWNIKHYKWQQFPHCRKMCRLVWFVKMKCLDTIYFITNNQIV